MRSKKITLVYWTIGGHRKHVSQETGKRTKKQATADLRQFCQNQADFVRFGVQAEKVKTASLRLMGKLGYLRQAFEAGARWQRKQSKG